MVEYQSLSHDDLMKPKFAYMCHFTYCIKRKCYFKPWDNAVGLKPGYSNFEIRLSNLLLVTAIIFGDSCCVWSIVSAYPISAQSWTVQKSVMSRNARFSQWEWVFWLEYCVHNKPRDSRWRTNIVVNAFRFHECGPSGGIMFISNWVKYCPNYKLKGELRKKP